MDAIAETIKLINLDKPNPFDGGGRLGRCVQCGLDWIPAIWNKSGNLIVIFICAYCYSELRKKIYKIGDVYKILFHINLPKDIKYEIVKKLLVV